MNTLFNTPIKIKASSEYNFDDKIIMLFAVLLSVLILMVVLFVDIASTIYTPNSQI